MTHPLVLSPSLCFAYSESGEVVDICIERNEFVELCCVLVCYFVRQLFIPSRLAATRLCV